MITDVSNESLTANNQTFSIHQSNQSSIFGIFAFLKDLNGVYGSRYEIECDNSSNINSLNSLDKFYEKEYLPYHSSTGFLEIKFRFDSPFLLRGYAISNGVQVEYGNSYPDSWEILGIDNKGRNLLDKQENQQFCDKYVCTKENPIGYSVRQVSKGYKEFIFKQTHNSAGNDYIYMRSIDFFGTLCSSNSRCICPRVTCKIHHFSLFITPISSFFILNQA